MPSATPAPPKSLPPERRAVDSLACALLLAFIGGVLDAFLYLDHGHVFAGAMTGNAVLVAVALLNRNVPDALMHLLPLLCFALGAWFAYVAETRLGRHSVTSALTVEAAALLATSFLPNSLPNLVFITIVSGLAGFQVASFRTVDHFSYSSTFITGEMRESLDALHNSLNPKTRRKGLLQFRDLALVILLFLLGAVAGALLAVRIGNHTLWLPVALLLIVLAIVHPPLNSSIER